MTFTTDNPAAAVRSLLAEFGLCIDPRLAGECRWLFENRSYRMKYQRTDGLTIDRFSEMLHDRGVTSDSLTEAETLDLLADVMRPAKRAKGRERIDHEVIDLAASKATKMRLRKYQCETCGQIARGTRTSDLICGRCYGTDGTVTPMSRIDPLPEEINLQHAA